MLHERPPTTELLPSSLPDPLVGEAATARKRQLPNKITTAKQGPLALQTPRGVEGNSSTLTFQGAPVWDQTANPSHARKLYTNPSYQQISRRRSLTRFLVPNVQRPIDQIDGELGELSCAELSESVQLLSVSQSLTYPWRSDQVLKVIHFPASTLSVFTACDLSYSIACWPNACRMLCFGMPNSC